MWTYLLGIKRSVIAFVVVAAPGLLSMGFLGAGLYYAVFFALPSSYPNLDDLRGDWVWPAIIFVGLAWSVGFLFAGELNRRLESKQTNSSLRKLIYVAMLWVWALALWWIAFATR
jgi:hypothetical protein